MLLVLHGGHEDTFLLDFLPFNFRFSKLFKVSKSYLSLQIYSPLFKALFKAARFQIPFLLFPNIVLISLSPKVWQIISHLNIEA